MQYANAVFQFGFVQKFLSIQLLLLPPLFTSLFWGLAYFFFLELEWEQNLHFWLSCFMLWMISRKKYKLQKNDVGVDVEVA